MAGYLYFGLVRLKDIVSEIMSLFRCYFSTLPLSFYIEESFSNCFVINFKFKMPIFFLRIASSDL